MVEGNMYGIAMQDAAALPGSESPSRRKGSCRNLGGPTVSAGWSPAGAGGEGRPEPHAATPSEVGSVHSTVEAVEGNDTVEGRGRLEGIT